MNWRRVLPFLFLLAVVPALLFLAKPETFNFVRRLGQQPISAGGEYFLTELRVIVTYLRLLFVPLKQNLDYDYPAASGLNLAILGSIFILAVIIASAIRLWTRYRILSFAIFWFFLTLLPDSSIIPLDDVIFEHRLYLAAVGYGIFLTAALNYLLKERAPKLLLGILSLLVIAYSLQAYQRNKVWKDELSLWNDAVFKSPRKSRPYSNRGLAYFKKGDFKRAFSDYLKAIQLDPNSAEAYNNRGLAYEEQGDFKQAVSDYTRAIEIRPKYVNSRAYYNRGHAYQSQGKFDEALSDYSEAIRLSPNFAQAYVNRGLIYRGQGNFEQAILDYNKAIQLNLNFAEAYNNRGFAYHGQGDLKQAVTDYNKAIAINPNYAQALQNRAIAYFHQKEYAKSWEDVRKAEALGLEINAEFLEDLKMASGKKQ
jgi:tetratricopeptide (TPR) repeat protein